jgi:hypothetical protein
VFPTGGDVNEVKKSHKGVSTEKIKHNELKVKVSELDPHDDANLIKELLETLLITLPRKTTKVDT